MINISESICLKLFYYLNILSIFVAALAFENYDVTSPSLQILWLICI